MGYDIFGPREFARKPLRLQGGDYAKARAYFVTTCTEHRDPLFAIPELYQIALDTWNGMPQRFPSVSFDEFVIMPDHVHCIIWLNKTQSEKPLTVGQVIGAYKSLVVVTWLNYIKEHDLNRSGKIWQRGFNDHIVRFGELEQKRQYIRNNPLKLKK